MQFADVVEANEMHRFSVSEQDLHGNTWAEPVSCACSAIRNEFANMNRNGGTAAGAASEF